MDECAGNLKDYVSPRLVGSLQYSSNERSREQSLVLSPDDHVFSLVNFMVVQSLVLRDDHCEFYGCVGFIYRSLLRHVLVCLFFVGVFERPSISLLIGLSRRVLFVLSRKTRLHPYFSLQTSIIMRLVKFLMKLSHETVSIELKNGSTAVGTINGVDIAMNIHMRQVKVACKNQDSVHVDALTVRGNNIRYIIFSEALALDTLLIDDEPKKKMARGTPGGRGGRGRGGRGRGRGKGFRGRGR
uniref:Small nuclear ribonucleoprotein Sm D1 n=1 Tax=Steinernema glaseri TaxID=37863 RepID=A0A1I7YR06_9BILA